MGICFLRESKNQWDQYDTTVGLEGGIKSPLSTRLATTFLGASYTVSIDEWLLSLDLNGSSATGTNWQGPHSR